MQTFKSLLANIIDEVATKFNMNKDQLGTIMSREMNLNTGNNASTQLQEILARLIKPQIIKGLDVTATIPASMKVNISVGYGSAQGKVHEIVTPQQAEVQNVYGVYYILIEGARIKVSTIYSSGLALAKIIIPNPGVTNKILNDKNPDSDFDGYIVSGKDLLFDNNFIIDDESLGQLKNVMSKIFAEYIFGTLRLSESLKIENTQGTMVADSQCIKFFNTNGNELAYYGGDEARIGNIKVTPSTVQSRDFQEGAHGFRLKDNGDAEFDNITARGTIHASAGTIDGNLTVGGSLSSPNFTSGYSGNGWKIDGDGTATFQNGLFRGELHTSVFVKDEIHATNGTLVVTNASVLASGTLAADTTIYTKEAVFSNGDIVRLKPDASRSEYMSIDSSSSNVYTVTRDLDGTGANNFEAGDAIVSQQSRIDLVASGDTAAYLPYIDVIKRNSIVWNDTTTKVRLGNLAGITDANFGTLSDYGLYTSNGYFTGLLKASNFSAGTISGTNIAGTNIYGANITGGTISGTTITGLNLNGQTITGVILTSPTIQTAASGARLELDYTGLTAYDASNNITFDTIISGTNSGDVVIGSVADGKYLLWDKSTGSMSLKMQSGTQYGIAIEPYAGIDMRLAIQGSLTHLEFLDEGVTEAVINLPHTDALDPTAHVLRINADKIHFDAPEIYLGSLGFVSPGDRFQYNNLLLNSGTNTMSYWNRNNYYQNPVSGTVPAARTFSHYKNYDWYPSANSPLLVDNYTSGYGAIFRNNYNDPIYGMGAAAQFTVEGENAGNAMYVVNKGSSAIQFGIQLDNNSRNGYGIFVHNISSGTGQQITQWANGLALGIQNCDPSYRILDYKGINIYNTLATGGYGIQINNIYTSTGGTGIEIYNGTAAKGETIGLYINNNSANYGIKLDSWSGDAGLYVYNQSVNAGILCSTISGTAIQTQAVGANNLALKAHGSGATYGDMGFYTYGDGRCYSYAYSAVTSNAALKITQFNTTAGTIDIEGSNTSWYILRTGDAYFTSHQNISDERIKTNIIDIKYGLDTICSLDPIKFNFKKEYLENHTNIIDTEYYGFKAQDFRKVFPDSVKTDKDGYFSIDKTDVIPHLVASIKELKERIDTLESQVKTLMEKNYDRY